MLTPQPYLILLSFLCSLDFISLSAFASAPVGPWSEFMYAPKSRVVYPRTVKEIVGAVRKAESLVTQPDSLAVRGATLSGNQSWLTLDFGVEVPRAPLVRTVTHYSLISLGRRTGDDACRLGIVVFWARTVVHRIAAVHQSLQVGRLRFCNREYVLRWCVTPRATYC